VLLLVVVVPPPLILYADRCETAIIVCVVWTLWLKLQVGGTTWTSSRKSSETGTASMVSGAGRMKLGCALLSFVMT